MENYSGARAFLNALCLGEKESLGIHGELTRAGCATLVCTIASQITTLHVVGEQHRENLRTQVLSERRIENRNADLDAPI